MPTGRLVALLTAVSLATAPLFGWGRDGHRLIAAIATQYLTSQTRSSIESLLEPGETPESVSTWADEIRNARQETSTWHYINIPVTERRGDWKRFCPDSGCVPSIVLAMAAKLKDTRLSRAERAEALKFLIHFVGDLHQPLHAGDRGDRGGNDVPVVFLGRAGNLHSLWDTSLLAWAIEREPSLKDRLISPVSGSGQKQLSRGSIADWAWQSRDLARDVAYAFLPSERPAKLEADYGGKALPSIELQLRRAGLRLARLLNDSLGR
jgi:hypothetical protein